MKTSQSSFRPTILAILFASATIASAAEFTPLGELPGGRDISEAYGVSGDGNVVFGASESSTGHHAFKWTEETGMVELERHAGGNSANPLQSNYDGSVIVGNGSGGAALIWTDKGLRKVTGMRSINGVAEDSTTFVGNSCCPKSAIWTEHDGINSIGSLPGYSGNGIARDISADGTIVVGIAGRFSGPGEAYRWTEADGFEGLGFMDGKRFSFAERVSTDGSTIVGYGDSNSGTQAFRWTRETGLVPMGDIPGGRFRSWAFGVSGDGSVIVGSANCPTDACAFVWDEANGMRDINDLLANEFGLADELAGWQLTEAWGVSDDGNVIVGRATNPDGDREAFRVILSENQSVLGDFDGDNLIGVTDIDLLAETIRQGTNDPSFELDGSEGVDFGDMTFLVEEVIGTWFGDSNLDGEFGTADLIQIFQAGEYEDSIAANSTWAEGDWNGDQEFDTGDLIMSFQSGGFEIGQRTKVASVPEPASWAFCLFAGIAILRIRRLVKTSLSCVS